MEYLCYHRLEATCRNERYLFVEIDGVSFSLYPLTTRIPQRTVFGALVYVLMANYSSNCLTYCNTITFADNTTLDYMLLNIA